MLMLIPMVSLAQKIELNSNNYVMFRGVVNGKSVAKASRQMLYLSLKAKPDATIYLILDSPGGSVYDGLNFVRTLAAIPQNVECVAIRAHSMAHHFLQACPGKRHILFNGMSMAHRASGSFRGTFNKGRVEKQLELWTEIVQSMEKVNAKRMGLSLEKYQSYAKDEYWCYGMSCKNKNFVDEISSLSCSQQLLQQTTKEVRHTFFGKYELIFSKCPMISYPKIKRIRR